jgi:hypothetical protein
MSDYGDPELGDENDPEYQNEIFEILRQSGTKPEDLPDPKEAALYAKWLKDRPTGR